MCAMTFPSNTGCSDHLRLTHEIELFYYTKRESQVVTPIGWATVASYREEDQMLVVTLPFCRPAARMWIPVKKVLVCTWAVTHRNEMLRYMQRTSAERNEYFLIAPRHLTSVSPVRSVFLWSKQPLECAYYRQIILIVITF